jgi:prophage regulatory protein
MFTPIESPQPFKVSAGRPREPFSPAVGRVTHAARVYNTEIPADAALLSMPQLETLIGLNKTRIYKWLKLGLFPKPIKLGKTSRWQRAEVEHWLADLKAARGLAEGGAA